MIKEFVNKIKNNEIDIVEHVHKVINECKKINKEYNYFNVISEDLAIEQANEIKKQLKNKTNLKNKKLLGVAVSAKDAICIKDVESTAGSRILKGYKPLFDATVIRKAKEAGAIIIGKTSQDEFGFGSFSVNVVFPASGWLMMPNVRRFLISLSKSDIVSPQVLGKLIVHQFLS